MPFAVQRTAFRWITCGAFLNPCVFFIQFKAGINIRNIAATYCCRNMGDILLFRFPLVPFPKIGTIGYHNGFFLRGFLPLKAVFEKLAVRIDVLLKRIIGYDTAILVNRFFKICHIAPVFLSGFCAVGSIRIRRVLEDGG